MDNLFIIEELESRVGPSLIGITPNSADAGFLE